MDKTKSTPAVDPRVQRTRALIQDAMSELMGEKGLSAITVQEITDRATINRATFYAHYEDKFNLFTEMMRGMLIEKLAEHIPDQPGLTAPKMRALILALAEMKQGMDDHCAPADEALRSMLETELLSQIKQMLFDWCGIRPGVPADRDQATRASLLAWGIFGAVNDWARDHRRESSIEFAERLSALLEAERAGLLRPM